jgi:hypothetical protein
MNDSQHPRSKIARGVGHSLQHNVAHCDDQAPNRPILNLHARVGLVNFHRNAI